MFPRSREDFYIDSLIRDHDAGLHDLAGEETSDCPACEDRFQEEQAAALELQDEEVPK